MVTLFYLFYSFNSSHSVALLFTYLSRLLLCYVSSEDNSNLLAASDVYGQYLTFCQRVDDPFAHVEWNEFSKVLGNTYPKAQLNGKKGGEQVGENLPLSCIMLSLMPRNWNERAVKSTEKTINALLTLRSICMMLIREGRGEYFLNSFPIEGICKLACLQGNSFLSKHFSLLMSEVMTLQ